MRRHVAVILERVQIHPGQQKLAAAGIGRRLAGTDFFAVVATIAMVAVIGLVHVPEKNQIEFFFGGRHGVAGHEKSRFSG
jgi:hypothetical protein